MRAAPTVAFTRPDGDVVELELTPQAEPIAIASVGAGRRALTAAAALPDPAAAGDAWLISTDRQGSPTPVRINSASPGGTAVILTEPLPHDVQADGLLQFAEWWAPMAGNAGGALEVAGVGAWVITAPMYAPDGTAATATYQGAFRALRRFDTGLTEHILLDVHPELVVEQRRHANLRPRIAEGLRLIRERLRAEIQPMDLDEVPMPGEFAGVHIDYVRMSYERDPAIREQLKRAIDERWGYLTLSLRRDRDGDGLADPPQRQRRDVGHRNLPARQFFTHGH